MTSGESKKPARPWIRSRSRLQLFERSDRSFETVITDVDGHITASLFVAEEGLFLIAVGEARPPGYALFISYDRVEALRAGAGVLRSHGYNVDKEGRIDGVMNAEYLREAVAEIRDHNDELGV